MTSEIIATIDAEIARLVQARKLLENTPDVLPMLTKRRGRPKGSTNAPKAVVAAPVKRTLSAEGRAKIAAAQKARHAAKKSS